MRAGTEPELVWLLEHPASYTGGTSASDEDLLDPKRFPVYRTGRGGQFTYHGPGQRVAYVILDLKRRRQDVRCFVYTLEEWLIKTLAEFNIKGERRQGRIGIWVSRTDLDKPLREDKVGALGIRIKRWVTLHGVALNVSPNLEHFSGIVACGLKDYEVTSLVDLGKNLEMPAVDAVLQKTFSQIFGSGSLMEKSIF